MFSQFSVESVQAHAYHLQHRKPCLDKWKIVHNISYDLVHFCWSRQLQYVGISYSCRNVFVYSYMDWVSLHSHQNWNWYCVPVVMSPLLEHRSRHAERRSHTYIFGRGYTGHTRSVSLLRRTVPAASTVSLSGKHKVTRHSSLFAWLCSSLFALPRPTYHIYIVISNQF